MATQTTGGGSTTSILNTPQATADNFTLLEDEILAYPSLYNYNTTSKTFTFDVMSNDLGGNAKSLFSVEDDWGNPVSGDTTLLDKDTLDTAGASQWEQTAQGNWIRIVSGKIEYRIADPDHPLDPEAARDVNSLGVSDSVVGDTFVYAIRLGNGTLSKATVTVNILGANDGPNAVADTATTGENAAINVDVLANDCDPDSADTLTVTSASAPAGQGTASVVSNQVHFDPGADFDHLNVGDSEIVTVSYTISDGHGGTAMSSVAITVTGTNDGPVANPDTDSGGENQVLTIDVLANDTDVDDGAVLTVTAASAPVGQGTASVVSNQVQFDPGTDFDHLAEGATAHVTVSYTIEDEHGASSSSTIDITVTGTNDSPSAVADTDATGENATVLVDVLANDTDPDDGAVLTVTAASAPPGQGSASVVSNQVQFDPGTDFDYLAVGETASVTVDYTIEDEHGASSSSTITITITGQNDAPVAVAVEGDANEDGPSITVSADFTDADVNDMHTFSVDTTGTLGSVTDNGGGTFSYDPNGQFESLDDGETATDTFTYTVDDGNGGSDTATVTITITGENDAPTTTAVTLAAIAEDSGARVITQAELLAYATDVDGDALTATDLQIASGGGTLDDNGDGTWTYTPAENDDSSVSFTYTVTDNDLTASGSATLDITPVNDAPMTAPVTLAAIAEDSGPRLITQAELLANATDLDGDSLTATGLQIASGNGTLDDNGDGTWTYTPAENDDASVSFTYTVSDNDLTASGSATLDITPVNDAPVIDGGDSAEFSIPENSTAVTTVTATDVENETITWSIVGGADQALFSIDSGTGELSFLSAPDFENPTDSDDDNIYEVQVQASDGSGGVDTQDIDVTVTDVVERLKPTDISLTPQAPSDTVNFSTFTFNGTLTATDPDPGTISFSIVSQTGGGNFSITGGNTLTSNDIVQNSTYSIDIKATQSGDPSSLFLTETFTIITGNNASNGVASTDSLSGVTGDDVLYGNGGSDMLFGLGGNDTLFGQAGTDRLEGGAGSDTLSGGTGTDTFVLTDSATFDTITDYEAGEVIDLTSLLTWNGTSTGFVRLMTNGDLQIDANGATGGVNFSTVAHINTAGVNATISYTLAGGGTATAVIVRGAPPVALDMDGDGQISFLAADAGATFDYGGGKVATAWVAGNDGILVNDANHDGQASADEVVFATSGSDLDGLSAYDSNHDGQLSSADEAFAGFQVWQDANSNGVVDTGEMTSLTALGITSISLTSDGIGYSAADGDVQVVGTGSYNRADGTTGVLADSVFATGGLSSEDQIRAAFNSGSNVAMIGAIAAVGLMAVPVQAEFRPATDSAPDVDGLAQAVSVQRASTIQGIDENHALGGETQIAVNSPAAAVEANVPAATDAPLDSHVAEAGTDASAEAMSSLLQGTTMPDSGAAAQVLGGGDAVLPVSAEMLQAAMAGIALHGVEASVTMVDPVGELSRVLSDAIAGGSSHAPDVDALLSALPGADSSHSPSGLAIASGGDFAADSAALSALTQHMTLASEIMLVHQDALPPAV